MSTSNTSRPAVRSPPLGEHWDEKPDSNWQCPYCEAFQVLLEGRYDTGLMKIRADGGLHGKTALLFQAVVCSNNACKKMTLKVRLAERQDIDDGFETFKPDKAIGEYPLMPSPPTWKTLPDDTGIGEAIRNDYVVARRLREASPSASAVYARRALGGSAAIPAATA